MNNIMDGKDKRWKWPARRGGLVLGILLAFTMVLSFVPGMTLFAFAAEDGRTVLAFTSDVHNTSSNQAADRLGTWLDNEIRAYGTIEGMGFCGDMGDAGESNEATWWSYVQKVIDVANSKVDKVWITTGNHEFYNGNYASSTNAVKNYYTVDAEAENGGNYRIYCLGTDNWDNSSDNYTEEQVRKLTSYLNSVGTDKPIIVLTHFPLHTASSSSSSWFSYGRTTKNADKVIDALNAAGNAGKKVVLLWGHNHTLADPMYDQVEEPGSTINYSSSDSKTINFYYAAAGCMSDSEYSSSGSGKVMGKGLIITVADSDDALDFHYHNAAGKDVTEDGSGEDPTPTPTPGVETKYNETGAFEAGKNFVVAVADGSKVHAIKNNGSSNSTITAVDLTVASGNPASVTTDDTSIVWTCSGSEGAWELTNDGLNFYPTSANGVVSYNRERKLSYSDGHLFFVSTQDSNTYYVAYSNGEFSTTTDASKAATFRIFVDGEGGAQPATTYTVTFESNGGSAVASQTVVEGKKASKPTDPTRSGYGFDGWYTDSSLKNAYDFNTAVTKDLKLYAKWTERDTQTFKLVDAIVDGGQYLIVADGSDGLRALTNPGGTSDGASMGKTTVEAKSGDVDGDGKADQYIQVDPTDVAWKAAAASVTSDDYGTFEGFKLTNGSDWLEGASGNVKVYSAKKNDYVWTYTNGQLQNKGGRNTYTVYYSSGSFTSSYNSTDATVQIYQLVNGVTPAPKTYTVTFDSAGGSAVAPQTVAEGAKATKPADPTRSGYTFGGWTLNGSAYDFGAAVTSNITLVASWDEVAPTPVTTYTVTFNSNGGSAVASQTVESGAKASKPADPTRSGYEFGGWYSNRQLTTAYDFDAAVTRNVTLYAKWTEVEPEPATTYTVTFDSAGGSAVAPQTVAEGEKASKPADPTRDGYEFVGWTLDGEAYDFGAAVTSDITLVAGWDEAAPEPEPGQASVIYSTHVQTYGWQDEVADGAVAGTSGESKRLEALTVRLGGVEGSVRYTTHVQTYGWLDAVSDGEVSGTSGESKRLEAVRIWLEGEAADLYDVYYRVHAQTFGWMGWAKNGEAAGSATYAKRLEGLQVVLVEKGAGEPAADFGGAAQQHEAAYETRLVAYRSHVQTYGWQDWAYDGEASGTSGESKRLEAVRIKLPDALVSGSIVYSTHVQTYGWLDEVADGELSGTEGESKRLEAITVRLEGEAADLYDVYYRVHAQTFGWLGWASDGDPAGTAGLSKRLEALEVVLVEKGAPAPGSTVGSFIQG